MCDSVNVTVDDTPEEKPIPKPIHIGLNAELREEIAKGHVFPVGTVKLKIRLQEYEVEIAFSPQGSAFMFNAGGVSKNFWGSYGSLKDGIHEYLMKKTQRKVHVPFELYRNGKLQKGFARDLNATNDQILVTIEGEKGDLSSYDKPFRPLTEAERESFLKLHDTLRTTQKAIEEMVNGWKFDLKWVVKAEIHKLPLE